MLYAQEISVLKDLICCYCHSYYQKDTDPVFLQYAGADVGKEIVQNYIHTVPEGLRAAQLLHTQRFSEAP